MSSGTRVTAEIVRKKLNIFENGKKMQISFKKDDWFPTKCNFMLQYKKININKTLADASNKVTLAKGANLPKLVPEL